MGARIKTLKEIGYRNEAQLLEKQVETSILRVEESQKFSMTIAQCEDYPRQPTPTNSTPVRQLRDDIAKGESLIQGISRASNILSKIEIDAHINEIKLSINFKICLRFFLGKDCIRAESSSMLIWSRCSRI